MESIRRTPDPAEAREALASIDRVQRAVRDTPWPTWIYPVNAALLGAMALTPLAPDHRRLGALTAVAVLVVAVNLTAGYRTGAPWSLPTSRTFLAAVAGSGLCIPAAFAVADPTGPTWPVVTLAVAAAALYLAGGVAHRRSTGRPR